MILSLTDDDSAYLLEDDSLFQSDHALGVERLESQIEHATKRLANILDLLETSEGTLRELQQARATELGQTLDDLKSTLAELVESQTETTMQLNRRQSSLQDIKAMKLDGYRALSESQKNNLLSALLGNTRIVLSPDGVVGFTRTPRPKTRMY
jgi:chromosome segregation ATPase